MSYSYNSGPTSSTSSRGIASVSFFEIQDVRASKGGTQFYSVGCSDGASGLAEITDVGRSYGSVCGTGGNLSTAVCKPKDTWSPRQAATLVCGGN